MSFVVCMVISAVVFIMDQLSKLWVLNTVKPVGSIGVIPGLLSFTYVENTGAAFGIFEGKRWLLVVIVFAVLVAALWALYTNKISGKLERLCISFIIAGGLGNVIDRIRYGFVVDFLDINEFFSYPMFNVADCFVVVGAILLVIATLFEDKKKKLEQADAPQEDNNADSNNGN